MDGNRFDRLSRAITGASTRRGALAALLAHGLTSVLGATLGVRALPHYVAAKGGKSGHRRKRQRDHTPACFAGQPCLPGTGQSNRDCDFSGSTVFRDLDAQGSNLRGANFVHADLSGVDLRGANLRGACLINANLTGATIDGSTSFQGAIFCNTIMPDGSARDTGCLRSTPCCNTNPPPGAGDSPGSCRVLLNPQRCRCVNLNTNTECTQSTNTNFRCQQASNGVCRGSGVCLCLT